MAWDKDPFINFNHEFIQVCAITIINTITISEEKNLNLKGTAKKIFRQPF